MGLINYIKETKSEMTYVKWPTKKQSIAFTAVVIVVSLVVAIMLGVFDKIFLQIISSLINR